MSERGKKMEKSFECDDAVSRILKRMWNCRGKHTTSIDKVAMEQIIRDELSTTQKPIECDDAVSREAVIGEFKDIYKAAERWSQNATEDDIEARADAVMAILMELTLRVKDLPSVTQKSESVTEFADRCRECGKMRKGHWIYDETIENWRCSKCNETPKTMGYVGTADFMAEHFKFCNHCGRRMVEPQESEE